MSPCQLLLIIPIFLTTGGHCRVLNTASSTFKPSAKEFQLPNGNQIIGISNNNNGSNSVNTRFFQQPNFHSFYNPSTTLPKFNSLFYPTPTLQQQPSHSFLHGIGNYNRQIRVPGSIYITINGRDVEITCQFERYIILVQGIYWHHNIEPYGSYFDTRNGFGPHVTVTNVNPWKSILTIKDFNEDDYGPYRCLSTAVLPADTTAAATNSLYNNYPEFRTNELEESKRKVRFTREIKDSSSFNNPVYDPFLSSYLGLNFNNDYRHSPHVPTPQQSFLPNFNNNFYPGGGYNGHHHHQPRFPSPLNFLHLPGLNSLWSVHAPYYKPSYSLSTVYQEVNFAPIGSPTTLSPGK